MEGQSSTMEKVTGENDSQALISLLEKVYRYGRYDFRGYRRGTITRRLERRLYTTGAKTYQDYMQFLDTHPEEYQRLADYLTITVSSFFRSPYTFQRVAKLVLPELVSDKINRGEQTLRLWCAACARGEEPYSVAIILADFLRNQRQDFDILIYATDINRKALNQAREGIYSAKDVENLPPAILGRYFTRHGESYVLSSDIRRMVNFLFLDLVSAPASPFMNLDCILCCNILIYLQRQQQEKILDMLYHSLNSPGYLILGEVETPVGIASEKLECLDSKARIYKRT